jgi:nucleotidyltransferase/DNA polymerase involved in DNA repair
MKRRYIKSGSNKVGKLKSCHQEREIEHFGVTMAKPLWSHAQGIGRKKISKDAKLLRSQEAHCIAIGLYHQLLVILN